jgi:hypothetical protein
VRPFPDVTARVEGLPCQRRELYGYLLLFHALNLRLQLLEFVCLQAYRLRRSLSLSSSLTTLGRSSRHQCIQIRVLGADLVLPATAILSPPEDVKRKLLGDCPKHWQHILFLIYTEPELDSTGLSPTPQVLARLVIRQRSPRNAQPEGPAESDTHLTYYFNDERTPLLDPPETSKTDDALDNIISPLEEIQVDKNRMVSIEDGLIEVYSPSVKRHRPIKSDTDPGVLSH